MPSKQVLTTQAYSTDLKSLKPTQSLLASIEEPAQTSAILPETQQEARKSATAAELAELALDDSTTNGMVTAMFASQTMGVNLDLQEMVLALNQKLIDLKKGNSDQASVVLQSQVETLNAVFLEMSRRAALNMGQNLSATEVFLRLALKTQNQVRLTLETIAHLKCPHVVIAKQANIAVNQMVKNNMP